jgi:ABC-type sugar transport system ATPase subunit
VRENLLLGRKLPRRAGVLIDWKEVDRRATALLDRVGLQIPPRTIVAELRADQMAMVAIAKAIASDAQIIVLDEPTAALLPHEVVVLFGQMRHLAESGHAFLYVSHRLTEVFDIADRITVLRDGRVAGSWSRAEVSRHAVVGAIVGRNSALLEEAGDNAAQTGAPLLVAQGLGGGRVADLSATVHAGEIVGFAGLPGSGAEEALDLLYGRLPRVQGLLTLDGHPLRFASPREAKRAGLALLPADRITESLLPRHSLRENMSLPTLHHHLTDPVFRFIRRRRECASVTDFARRLNVKAPGIEAPIEALSGGNQQKAMLGRWVASKARVFLLSSPTAAVDVGAKAEIYGLIRQIAADGAGVIFTSTEVEEFPRVCHRVLVFRGGRVVGELVGRAASENRIMQLAVGDEHEPERHS